MEESLKIYEKSIDKKHGFGWTPKYEEEFRTNLNEKVFISIAEKTFEKLNWDLVYKEDKVIEAKRKESNFGVEKWTEAISINFSHGKIIVKSESLGNEIWDNGKNSKRVKLFIHAFKEIEKSFDRESLERLEVEIDRKNNWDDYLIPENLSKPNEIKKANFTILLIGGFLISVVLAFILAQISVIGMYVIVLVEYGVALAIAFSLKWLIEISNFTELNKLRYLLIGIIILTYLLNQYFQYEIIIRENNYDRIGFLEFIKFRLEEGLIIKKTNTGWIGLVISWILQFVITYYIALLRLISNVASYQLRRVPVDVIDFAFYHFVKNKTEGEVRKELSQKGWTVRQNQDEVFEAINALSELKQLNR